MPSTFSIGASKVSPQVNFGPDSRKDVVDIENPEVLEQAKAVACLMISTQLVESTDGVTKSYTLSSSAPTLREKVGVAETEKFFDQPAPGFGTAFLVHKRYALTAGHCVDKPFWHAAYYQNIKLVFDFSVKADGVKRVFDESSVYGIKKVVAFIDESNGADWALVKLDRDVADINPLAVEFSQKISKGKKIHMLGHPTGLPLKHASGSEVKKKQRITFTGDLDSFHGNSGSPVINSKTNKVSGILIRGQESYSRHPMGERRVLQGSIFPMCQSTHKLHTVRTYLQAVGAIDDLKETALAEVQNRIARWYSQGAHGLSQNQNKAFKFYIKSAENGSKHGALALASLYKRDQNYENAFNYYKRAAELKCKRAQYKVAEGFRYGIGVEKDKAQAVKWYKKSANRGSIKALERLVKIYKKGQCGKDVNLEKAAGYSERIADLKKSHEKTLPPSTSCSSFQLGVQVVKSCLKSHPLLSPLGELL